MPREARRGGKPAQVGDRRIQIDKFNEAFGNARFCARCRDDEWGTAASLEERVFVPPAAFAEMIAMIADEDDDCLIP